MTKIERGAVIRTANAWDNFAVGRLAATIAPVPLATAPTPIMEVIVQNNPGGQESAYVGNVYGQPFVLTAGSSVTIPVCDLSLVYVTSVSGTVVINWLAGI